METNSIPHEQCVLLFTLIQVYAVPYLAYNEPCVLWKDEMMEHLLQSLEEGAHASAVVCMVCK
jgi:hypothetical protein